MSIFLSIYLYNLIEEQSHYTYVFLGLPTILLPSKCPINHAITYNDQRKIRRKTNCCRLHANETGNERMVPKVKNRRDLQFS